MTNLIIGHAESYYTLWSANPTEAGTQYTYIKNISKSLQKAKEAYPDAPVDTSLRGMTRIFVPRENTVKEVPEDVFRYGEYRGQKIAECDDLEYLCWFFSNKELTDLQREVLESKGLVIVGWTVCKLEDAKVEKLRQSAKHAHWFSDGERPDFTATLVESFYTDGHYGRIFIKEFVLDGGVAVKYVGGNPPDVEVGERVRMTATIKHSIYHGERETRIQRIKLRK